MSGSNLIANCSVQDVGKVTSAPLDVLLNDKTAAKCCARLSQKQASLHRLQALVNQQ